LDLTPSPDQERLRAEFRDWLRANLPWEYGTGLPPRFDDPDEEVEFLRDWQRKLHAAGWVAITWPREYGGRGLGPVEHAIVQEELARARTPDPIARGGMQLAAPTIMTFGTDDQKTRWLPRIPPADEIWCQLFSEPGAGSDLASLSTRAEQVAGGWVLNGVKVWTSLAQWADWGTALARSDPDAPKHKGITYFVVDMHAPGVDVQPLRQITDDSEFNQVFLTDVFVPDDSVLGPINEGWRVANTNLAHERGVNPRQLVAHLRLCAELHRLAGDNGAYDDPRLAARLAQAYAEVKIYQLHNWRTLSRLAKGKEPGSEASVTKLYWSEMTKRLHDIAFDVLGPASALWKGAAGNPGDGTWQRSYLFYQAASIFAGSNEIQRNLIGERILGLPREPKSA